MAQDDSKMEVDEINEHPLTCPEPADLKLDGFLHRRAYKRFKDIGLVSYPSGIKQSKWPTMK